MGENDAHPKGEVDPRVQRLALWHDEVMEAGERDLDLLVHLTVVVEHTWLVVRLEAMLQCRPIEVHVVTGVCTRDPLLQQEAQLG